MGKIYWQDMVRFIRTISRLHLEPGHRNFIYDFCKQDVPWEALISLAGSEGVDGILHYHLSRMKTIALPDSAKDRLAKRFEKHRQNQETILREAESISEKFEQKGISAIALQGVSLLEIYDAPGLRPMGDIDLLIQPDQYPHVLMVLGEIGFRIPHPAYPKNLRKGMLWLDLHTHFMNLDRIQSRQYVFPKDLSGLWNRAHPFFPSSTGLLTPDPMDNFALLSAHILKHNYSRMIWLVDLHEALQRIVSMPDGWEKLIERIRNWRLERIVLYGLTIVEGIFGCKLPNQVKKDLISDDLGSLEKYLLRLRIRGVNLQEYYVLLSFLAIKGVGRKIEFLYESLFPRDEIMSQIYLDAPSRSRFHQVINRVIQTLPSLGNGLKQALLNGPFSN